MILLIDNYDSFTYNLYQYLSELGEKVEVYRNDKITIAKIKKMKPSHIVISPGPGRPENAGISVSVVKNFYKKIPILGVCLGHQAIALAFGAKIINAPEVCHGKTTLVRHNEKGIYKGITNPFSATRYHSLIIDRKTLPSFFEVNAFWEKIIMGIVHKDYPSLVGVQYHPESFLTGEGKKILFNFIYGKVREEAKENKFQFYLNKVVEGSDLDEAQSYDAMNIIMEGRATPAQIAAFLTSLRLKGETVGEISQFARVMREKAVRIRVKNKKYLVDTCGTGGDKSGTFNISTASAFVAAAAGAAVAKHGNRSVSSKCGSADVLKGLGVNIEIPPQKVEKIINKINIGFLFAPMLHGAMKYAIGPRREMAIRTVFNVLGPLTNPAFSPYQVIGIFDKNMTELLAGVLKKLGTKRAFVAAGADGLDEITLTTVTKISELNKNKIKTFYFNPEDWGFKLCSLNDIKGGSLEENVNIIKGILNGSIKGPKKDIVIINSGFALLACGKAKDLKSAFKLARETIESKKALKKLDELIALSNKP